jgi:hypothetical protein
MKVPLSGRNNPPSSGGTCPSSSRFFPTVLENEEETMGKGILLWLLGVPIPVIILLWLFFGH